MKKIGFIDYYLDEWHANNYPRMIAEASNGSMAVTGAFGLIAFAHRRQNHGNLVPGDEHPAL